MLPTEQRDVDGERYVIVAMPFTESRKFGIKMAKLFAPLFGRFMKAIFKKDSTNLSQAASTFKDISVIDIDFDEIIKIAQDFFLALDDRLQDEIVAQLFKYAQTEGGSLNDRAFVDAHFGGRLAHFFKVLWTIVVVNYADVFQMLKTTMQGTQSED
jgi:hypothetical protein